jgi:CheY-like chemotaxis protein
MVARILLVDDLEAIRETTAALLEAAGYVVLCAGDGTQALAQIALDPAPDLLMTDIILGAPPNGFELAKLAVEREPAMKILYTTGYAWNLEDLNASVPGSRMLRKPYRARELLREVGDLLELPAPVIVAPDHQTQPQPRAKPTILVVEDDARSRAIAVDLFEGLGLTVLSADNAEDALTLLVRQPEIGTLFTDVRLPGMSGSELAVMAQKLRPALKIVLTSAYTDVSHVAGTRFIPKPWDKGDFARVAGALTRH